jgi:hypothetical protein
MQRRISADGLVNVSLLKSITSVLRLVSAHTLEGHSIRSITGSDIRYPIPAGVVLFSRSG